MKPAERTLCHQIIFYTNVNANVAYQESVMSPGADLQGLVIGNLSVYLLKPLLTYGAEKKQYIQEHAFLIQVIGSLGLAFTVASLLGKTWEVWSGDWCLALGGLFLNKKNEEINEEKPNGQLVIAMMIASTFFIGRMILKKSRNASLNITPYLVYGFAVIGLSHAYNRFALKKASDDRDKQVFCPLAVHTAIALLVAKAIQWKVGDKSFKFSYKAQVLSGAGIMGAYALFRSKRSPIYES